jgi:hypothetical protein
MSEEKGKHLQHPHYHCIYSYSPNLEDYLGIELAKPEHKDLLAQIKAAEDDTAPVGAPPLEDLLTRKQQLVNKLTDKHKRSNSHGIAIYANKGVFPNCQVVATALNHLIVLLQLQDGRSLYVGQIYGPSTSDAKISNSYYLSQLHPILSDLDEDIPLFLSGDFNAHLNLGQDMESPPSSPVTKTGFAEMCEALSLTDLGRERPKAWTHQARSSKSHSKLDYHLVNDAALDTFGLRTTTTRTHGFLPGYDHAEISITFKLNTKPVTEKFKVVANRNYRNLGEAAQEELTTLDFEHDTDDPERLLQILSKSCMTFINEHMKVTLRPHPQHHSKDYLRAERAQLGLYRVQGLLSSPPTYIDTSTATLASIAPPKPSNEALTSTRWTAKIRRHIRSIQLNTRDFPLLQLPESGDTDFDALVKAVNAALGEANKKKRNLQRKDKENAILKSIERLNQKYADNPGKWWGSIRRTIKGEAPFLMAVETEIDGITQISADPKIIKESVTDLYTSLCATKGDAGKDAFVKGFLKRIESKRPIPDQLKLTDNIDFAKKEVLKVIKSLKNNKGTGPDEIPGELYKALFTTHQQKEALLESFTYCLNRFKNGRTIPDSWRRSVTILLHKGKNASLHQVDKFRPIALLDVVYKIYATLLNNRLLDILLANNIVNRAQVGFLRNRGTAHKLLDVTGAIRHASINKKPLHMISIDFKSAFPSVEHWLIEEAMKFYSIPDYLIRAVMDTLRDKKNYFRLPCGNTEEVPIQRGVPQGDPLASTMFLIAMNPS